MVKLIVFMVPDESMKLSDFYSHFLTKPSTFLIIRSEFFLFFKFHFLIQSDVGGYRPRSLDLLSPGNLEDRVTVETLSTPEMTGLRTISWPRSPTRSFVRNFPQIFNNIYLKLIGFIFLLISWSHCVNDLLSKPTAQLLT